MADWQAFATAFLGDSAAYINERKDKAEDYADKLAEQAERNKGKLTELRQVADAQNSFVSQARSLYATDAQIEAALDAGPDGLSTLVKTLDTLRATYGSNFNADMVKEAAALPEAFSPTGNLDVYARYGLGSQVMGDIEAPKGGWFARAMGTDAKARARAEADAEAFGGTGMSVYDMAELDSVTGYTSKASGSYLRYTPPKVFNPANTAAAEEALYDREQILVDSEAYKEFQTRIAKVYAPTEAKANAIVAEIEQERAAWLRNNLTEYARSQQNIFGESWVDAMGPTLQAMGLSSDALKDTGRGTDSTTELPAAAEEAFDPTTLNLPKSLTVDDEGMVNGTVTVTHVNTEGESQDITFEVEGGLVLKDGVPLSPEQSEAVIREASKTTAAPVVPAEEVIEEVEDPIIKVGMRLLDGKDGDMTDYTRAYKEIMALPEEQRSAYVEAYNDLESVTSFADVVKDIAAATPEFTDNVAGKAMGYSVIAGNAITAALAKAYTLMTGDRTTAAGLVADSPRRRAVAEQMLAEGVSSALEDTIKNLELEKGDDKGLFRFSGFGQSNPDRARAVETQLLGSGKLGVFVDRLLGEVSKASAGRGIDTTEGRIDDLDKQFLADDKNFPQPAPRRYAPSTEQRLETPERRANAARDQRVSNEVNRRELTENATKIAEMLSRPPSEVSQEELTNFITEVNAKFGADAVKAELQRVIRGGAAKGGTE